MITLSRLLSYLEQTLGDPGNADPEMANGLQFRGQEKIEKIATGVSASLDLFRMAVSRKADCLIVHHGMPVPKSPYVDPIFARRLEYLTAHGLSLLGYHYLLDGHPELGHNAQILQRLGARRTEPFREGWGWYGELAEESTLSSVMAACVSLFGPLRAQYLFGRDRVRRLVVLSGSGSPRYAELPVLQARRVDLYITGEAREGDRELARESGLNLIAGGHHRTERFGLWALGDRIRQELPVAVEFVELPDES